VDLGRSLERRGFERLAIAGALGRLEREGWLDDLAAARSVVRARGARYGKARIARELAALGFSKETAAAALGGDDGPGEREQRALRRAFEGAWKRSRSSARRDEPLAARKRRVRAALMRRGFASDAISAMMRGSSDDRHEEDLDLG
jgi:SOS response regulatory protein OraA/RecX